MTVDEIVAALRHGTMSYLIVEGKREMQLYRHLLGGFPPLTVQLQVCDGRDSLLKVYERRNEFSNVKVVFLADQDMWIYDPALKNPYPDLVWTHGYCIENDLLACYAVGDLLLEPAEKVELGLALNSLIDWFSFEVEEFTAGRAAHVAASVTRVLGNAGSSLCPRFVAQRSYSPVGPNQRSRVSIDPWRLIRGKQLLDLLVRYLDKPGREARYSKLALLDLCLRLGDRPLKVLAEPIEMKLRAQGVLP